MDEKLGVVLIDFNSQQRTIQYISDLLKSSDITIDVLTVIDNSPGYDNFYALEKSAIRIGFKSSLQSKQIDEGCIDKIFHGYIGKTEIIFIHSRDNLGFAKANNLGLRVIRSCYNVNYILFSNSDILFIDNKVNLGILIDVLRKNKSGFLVGPQVVYPDGRPQSPCRYVSLIRRWWKPALFWPIAIHSKSSNREIIINAKEGKVYRIIGAFMLADAKKLEEIGGFDNTTFLYAEELILAERGKKFGYDVLYTPEVKIIHENGVTVRKNKTPASRDFKLRQMLKSDLYYYRQYIGVNRFVIFLTKFVVGFYLFKLHIKDVLMQSSLGNSINN